MSNIGGIAGGFNPAQMFQKAQERFATADVDQSGSVSKQEFLNSVDGVKGPGKPEVFFDRMDANGDGVLTQEEHQAALDRMAERMEKMGAFGANPNQAEDNFSLLLEAISSSETDEQKSQSVREIMEDLRASSDNSGQGLQRAMMEFDQVYPRIDLLA